LAKSIIQMDINETIKQNEIRALALLEMNEMGIAENCLNENLRIGTNSSLTYDLLIDIYSKKNDYQSLIKTLNNAVKYSDKKEIYRKFRKAIIFNKLMKDIDLSTR
jgi:tetratricopeptide (TPR) repeat protein